MRERQNGIQGNGGRLFQGGQLEDGFGFGKGPEGDEEGSHMDIRRKNDPSKGNNLSKGHEAGPCWACVRHSKLSLEQSEQGRK